MSSSKEIPIDEIEKRNNQYYSITKQEIVNGIRLSSKNARSLFDSAIHVNNVIGNRGLANSLLILAAEESIKSFVLCAVLFDIPVPFLLEWIFSKHWVKHDRGKELNQIVEFMSTVADIFLVKKNKTNTSFVKIITNILKFSKREEWWVKANLDKNNGLYVGIVNNRFVDPSDLSQNDFEESKHIVGHYVELMEILSGPSLEELLPLFK